MAHLSTPPRVPWLPWLRAVALPAGWRGQMASRPRGPQRGPIPSIFQGLRNPNLPTAITGFWIDDSCGPNLDVSGCLHHPHIISFKIHLLIANSPRPQSPPSGGGRGVVELLTPEAQDCCPLLALLQLSHPIRHQVLLNPPWKHPRNALSDFHLHGHRLAQVTTISALDSHHSLCAHFRGASLASIQVVLSAADSGVSDNITLNLPSSSQPCL